MKYGVWGTSFLLLGRSKIQNLPNLTQFTREVGDLISWGSLTPYSLLLTPYTFAFFSRKLLVTTNTLLKAIAPAASIGLSRPKAAAGIRMTL